MRIASAIATSVWAGIASIAGAQTVERVSVSSLGSEGDGPSDQVALSADGRFVAFRSAATNLVRGDRNGVDDVFVHDRVTGETERVSVSSAGVEGDGHSERPALSADGRFVAFDSRATNLVAGDTNGCRDVFVHDRLTGRTVRASVDSHGQQGNLESSCPFLSADGRVVSFMSFATTLVPDDQNGFFDVFVHEVDTGLTECVSVDARGVQGDGVSYSGSLSADGRQVLFSSRATNFAPNDTNGQPDLFIKDRATGALECIDVEADGSLSDWGVDDATMSPDGRFVAFVGSDRLVGGHSPFDGRVLLRDRRARTTTLMSANSKGIEANFCCISPGVSADGRTVTFLSGATNLPGHVGTIEVYVRDVATGLTTIASDPRLLRGRGGASESALSADGRTVAFVSSRIHLVDDDSNHGRDVFVVRTVCEDASATAYGDGVAGTNGVPTLTPSAAPVLGTKVDLALTNSSGVFAPAVLFTGGARAQLPTGFGGDLLVAAPRATVLALPPGGTTIRGAIPREVDLFGVQLDLQAIELDAGAAQGVSFTAGLELVLGR
jgi:Tol biopolymer transport system component